MLSSEVLYLTNVPPSDSWSSLVAGHVSTVLNVSRRTSIRRRRLQSHSVFPRWSPALNILSDKARRQINLSLHSIIQLAKNVHIYLIDVFWSWIMQRVKCGRTVLIVIPWCIASASVMYKNALSINRRVITACCHSFFCTNRCYIIVIRSLTSLCRIVHKIILLMAIMCTFTKKNNKIWWFVSFVI